MTKAVIIGSGNVAWSLAHYLPFCSCCVMQIVSRTQESAQSLASTIGADFTTDFSKIYANADFYIYAITDDALNTVITQVNVKNGLHLHTSGSVDMDVFRGKQYDFGVLYPFQTFSKQKKVDLNNVPFFIEANSSDNQHKLMDFAKKISLKVYEISFEQRKKVHLAGVFGNNFTNFLWGISYKFLKECNLPFSVILPLITESVDKLKYLTPNQAQTGPAARGDQKSIAEHLKFLHNNKDLEEIYALLTENIKRGS
ncbi:MAG: DUF2520 domain-containing protein [Prevotellaceae bacterium]|jgi:predicted short-subunit dehydrogenase-like oxidoreductase (DUF2520 family)|nr:DUF2520 domain-containing protein [Prevotellaceae bacterium]